jgi:hypothetical protein
LASRLASAHTTESGAAVIGSCRSEFPPGADLRKVQSRLQGIDVSGRAGLDESYGLSRTFSGTIWNGSSDHVVTELRIRLTIKPKEDKKDAPPPQGRTTWIYAVPVELLPQTAGQFSIPIVPVTDSEYEWGIVEAFGVPMETARSRR